MKAKIKVKTFKKSISKAYRLLPKKTSYPLLDCFLLSFKESEVIINATDLFSGIEIKSECSVQEKGDVAINGKIVFDLVNSLDCDEFEIFSSKEKENEVVLKTVKEQINLPIFDKEEYPKNSDFSENDYQFSLKKSELIKINELITFSVSNDLNKPIFNSFYFNLKKESVVVGTDSVRLSYLSIEESVTENKSFLLPKKNFLDLLSIVQSSEIEKINFFYKEKENILFLKEENFLYFTKINSGEYPPYQKIIPEDNDFKIIIKKDEFLKTLKKLSFFVRDNSNIVKLNIGENQIEFLAKSSDSGKYEGKIEVDNKTNKTGVIAFNIVYLLDYLNSIKGEEVEMMFSGSNRPVLFADLEEEKSKHLIMPFALND